MNQACISGDLKFICEYAKCRPITDKHLTCAYTNGNVVTIQYLYYLGYNVLSSMSVTCLMQFCDVLDFFVSSLTVSGAGFPINDEMADIICINSNEYIFDTLVKAGMPLNGLLHAAARAGNTNFINKLYGLGVDMNNRDEDGWTALFDACDGYELETAKLLIDLGVDVNAVDNSGANCLHIACSNDDVDMVKLLIHHHCLPVADEFDEYPDDKTVNQEIFQLVHVERPKPIKVIAKPRYSITDDLFGPMNTTTSDEYLEELHARLSRARGEISKWKK